MNLYQLFNSVEAIIWFVVALLIVVRIDHSSRGRLLGVVLGSTAFIVFGVTDLMELPTQGRLPMWLWSLKIACGVQMIAARYTWLGWSRFHWRHREVLFGLGCLAAVSIVISLQHWLE